MERFRYPKDVIYRYVSEFSYLDINRLSAYS